jgi:DNA modification methylase
METKHLLIAQNSNNMSFIDDNSIHLTVTSPPYPMIEMWDDIFGSMNYEIKIELEKGNGAKAFELMHKELDKVWSELYRVTSPGGIVAINVGDATRTINNEFQIYMNGARIISYMREIGFSALPQIIWRKATNSPTKFMGSGMYPGGAYVTLEHEHILIFRKGNKRTYKGDSLIKRRESAYFWEERNVWFSDLWNIKGERQAANLGQSRDRTAAYPLELPLRIINMYSKYGDNILDPFLGTGTTTLASMILARNSIGIDIDPSFINSFDSRLFDLSQTNNQYYLDRITNHLDYVHNSGKNFKYFAEKIDSPVMTKQETEIRFYSIDDISRKENTYYLKHKPYIK